ncbi:hypothetical protein [Streptomyces buecherae]|uniref:hypothetical protein n=1 Tax=Streptomyces buecherae TaxID=2763006 RepID=UPI003656A6DA
MGEPTTGGGDMGTAQRTDAPPDAVADLAAAHGLGAHRSTELRGDSDGGCLGCLALVVLVPPGAGLLLGPYGPRGATIGATLLSLGLLVLVLGLRHARAEPHGQRVYCFEGGIVTLSGRGQPIPHAWLDLEAAEWTETATVGQGQQQSRYDVLELRDLDGTPLARFAQRDAARVAGLIAADEATRALRLLGRGESVRYGRFTLTSTGLTITGAPLPPGRSTPGQDTSDQKATPIAGERPSVISASVTWDEIRAVHVNDTSIELALRYAHGDNQGAGQRPSILLPRAEEPRERVAFALVRRLLRDPAA